LGSGGTLNLIGQKGGNGGNNSVSSGHGGSSFFAPTQAVLVLTGNGIPGVAGALYGGGASGGIRNGTDQVGAAGGAGVVILEY